MWRERLASILAVSLCASLYLAAGSARAVKPAYDKLAAHSEGHFAQDGWYASEAFVTAKPVRAWGSWCGSDDNHGALQIGPFRASDRLRFAVGGYPGKPGVELYVENVASRTRLPITTADVGERWRIIDVPLPVDWRGSPVVLGAVDRAEGHGGWVALTEPLVGGHDGTTTLLETLAAWAINGVLLGALWLAAVRLLTEHVPAAWLALLAAGFVAFAGYLTFWAYFCHPTLGKVVSMAFTGAAITSWWRSSDDELPREAAAVVRLAALIGAFYVGLLQLFPSAAPFYEVAANRFRENLPADNSLPHIISERLYEGRCPRELLGDWHSSDRPPLQSGWQLLTWAMTATLDISPDSASGTSALWLQLTWTGAAYGLFRALGLSVWRSSAWIALMAASGFFVQQTLFTWPKLAAGAFACGAFGLWVLRRPDERDRMTVLAGAALAAIAWLSHGGVAFSFLVLAPWVAWRAMRGEWRAWAQAALVFAVLVAPWAAYQTWYDPPGNRLLKWHLGGQIAPDPRGTWETIRANYAKLNWEQVRDHKLVNFAYQVHGDHASVADFSTTRARDRRNQEFFHLGRALTWWIAGLAAGPIALVLSWRRKKRLAVQPDTRVHVAIWLWPTLTIPIWCLLLFERGGAVLHQSSYAMVICAFVALSSALDAVGRWWIVPLAILQGVSFATTWAIGSTEINGAPHPLALSLVIATGMVLASCVIRGVLHRESKGSQAGSYR